MLFAKRDEESIRKIQAEMANGMDRLILKKLHIPTQANLIGQELTFAASVAKQRKSWPLLEHEDTTKQIQALSVLMPTLEHGRTINLIMPLSKID